MSLPRAFTTTAQHLTSITHRLGRTTLLVILLWATTLWWGERLVFTNSIAACDWGKWESWPAGATPHHVLFVADPQLVDPHTYPGRPWPLSTLTVLYTDLYLRRSYEYLLHRMQPQTTMFLGDLFDGGREWAAADYKSPEDRYKKYDTNFWLREYSRFMNMFIGTWYTNRWKGFLTGEGRKVIASLPGNHDLGFAGGINEHVRNRFEAYFGPSNRIDIMGNHTFVSLDTVSLSAMDQVDQSTGGSGAGDGTGSYTKHMEIWRPIEGFLVEAKNQRDKAVQRRFQHFQSLSDPGAAIPRDGLVDSEVTSTKVKAKHKKYPPTKKAASVSSSNFPTILLSHVPLYRNQEVTCGPLRERGNAIPLSAGYQYQNVLTPAVSKDIVDHLDAEQIAMIYSGDDHDYCEIDHTEFTGRVKEITVKSMSWAMGVRKPGVQLASLWNPLDLTAISEGQKHVSTPRNTVQNHLCLLPDQLAIFIRYGQILGFTVIILFIRAIMYNPEKALQQWSSSPSASPNSKSNSQPLLPLTRKRSTPPPSPYLTATATTTQTPLTPTSTTQTARPRPRSQSSGKASSYGNLPTSSRSGSSSPTKPNYKGATDDWGMPLEKSTSSTSSLPYPFSRTNSASLPKSRDPRDMFTVEIFIRNLITPASSKRHEFIRSFCLVAGTVLTFYFWLIWNG